MKKMVTKTGLTVTGSVSPQEQTDTRIEFVRETCKDEVKSVVMMMSPRTSDVLKHACMMESP